MIALLLGAFAAAQEPVALPPAAPEVVRETPEQVHDALRALRAELLAAVQARDVDRMLASLHPDVVFTTPNGVGLRGREAVKGYVGKMLDGPSAIVTDFAFDVRSDELSLLYDDDTAIAWGPSTDTFVLATGQTYVVESRWSATLVRVDGKWLVASAHSSANLFDTAVLTDAARWLTRVGLGAGAGGLALGLAVGFLLGRRRK
jgi:uncharacterized protein (TIGR02246 family)